MNAPGLLTLFLSAALLRAETQVDGVNADANVGMVSGGYVYPSGVAEIGWPFTPGSSHYITAVQSRFGATGTTDTRTVTLEIWQGIPASGGTLLRSAPFGPALLVSNGGTLHEATFEQLALHAGTTYFIGFKNVAGYGDNLTNDAGATALKPFYFGQDAGQNYPTSLDESYAETPIFAFFGPDQTGPLPVKTATVYAKNDPVPGAGTHGIPADALFASFGPPAVDGNSVGFIGHWASHSQTGALAHGTDLFLAGAPIAEIAGPVDALNSPFGASYSALGDPVLDSAGHVAFLATVSGHGITSHDNVLLISNAAGEGLAVVARTNQAAAELGDPALKYTKFLSIALPGGRGPLFQASLLGPHAATSQGVFCVDSVGAVRKLFVVGDPIGTSKLKSFSLLKAVTGSPGASRSYSPTGTVAWLAILTDGSERVMTTTVP